MPAHIIPAASNALMLKHLESEGFDKVYLDSRLATAQLLGSYNTDLLSMSAYLDYVSRLAAVTDMQVLADASVSDNAWTLSNSVYALQEAGCHAVVVTDAGFDTAEQLGHALNTLNKAISDETFEVIVKLDGFVKYGLDELQARIDIAQISGIDQIIISNISNADVVIIKAVATTVLISLIIDNENITYYGAQQLNPKFILDTYHVYTGLIQSARTISQNMILKLFMG
ncbi:isocitrate lyase/phosphoenolpyruvate mutase family protein [Companilactobacillus mishanensis]|uniref:Uncharacterized protein n=1 Tax=Companilactobacillus mishanensis TaxID=2486008 RepID=A0ABW9P8E8_9LACO|nr:isocitrate lyase/phosphoenolpyruvate mutase family protein [Companilactobacillus mishanensis]MQS45506.1 hypothetical protein [Companilactobacillus mishanensis]